MDAKTFENQLKRTFEEFRKEPQTMMQVSRRTGILRPNICRYVSHLRKRNKISVVKTGKCPITKHKAQFFSTDPELIPKPGQSELFSTNRCLV